MNLGDPDLDGWCLRMTARRPVAVISVVLAVLLASFAAEAQHAGNVHRIGVLGSHEVATQKHLWDAFRQGLRDLGYVEGQNLAIEWRSTVEKPERVSDLAAESFVSRWM